MITTILFDLDGTLLPMDQDVFTKAYFKYLAAKIAPLGYDPQQLIDGIWAGTAAMVKNDGKQTNEQAFWNRFVDIFGPKAWQDQPAFEEYYRNEFQQVKRECGFNPLAKETVDRIRRSGYRVALATNPIFPAVATESRIRWAGLEPDMFEYYTTYENSHYCKPNPEYYCELLRQIDCRAEECLMVGNDVNEDMIAETIGMKVFLLTDCLINKKKADISIYPNGDFTKLLSYLDSLNLKFTEA